jgi:hemoglobin
MSQLVEEFYQRVLQDNQLAPFFRNVDMQRLRTMQYEFLCSAFGGPIHYSGSELQAIHARRGITNQHFAQFVGHLAKVMEERGISPQAIDAMLGRLATFRDKIVGGANVDG